MRRSFFIGGVILAAAIVVVLMYQLAHTGGAAGVSATGVQSGALAQEVIHIKGTAFTVDVADTPAAQERGLGGKAGLAHDTGMLFVFAKDAQHAFWMKGMLFSIDMIWLSVDGRVVAMRENVSPDTYPEVLKPAVLSRYVLELDAGTAKSLNLQVGDTITL